MRGVVRAILVVALVALGACEDSRRSALQPAGIQAERIGAQWWFFMWVCVAVYAVVLALMLVAIARRRNAAAEILREQDAARERRAARAVFGGASATAAILFAFLLVDLFTGRAISSTPADPLKIKITGHQWWWQVEYVNFPGEPGGGYPHGIFKTANEIHVPIGVPVLLELQSADVIHSFWVPSLHGKKDLIPGQTAWTWLQADRPGTYFGQCAEYCGEQHSNMLIWVVAEPREEFDKWKTLQRASPGDPASAEAKRGREVFMGTTCAICHKVQGTLANGSVGPELTHVASRQRIASGALEFSHENLERWITNPQAIKPGTKMPQLSLPAQDVKSIADWLVTLK